MYRCYNKINDQTLKRINTQAKYLEILKIITSNEVLSLYIHMCFEDIDSNMIINDSSEVGGDEIYRVLDLFRNDQMSYEKHNLSLFNKKAEECIATNNVAEIEIRSSDFASFDFDTFNEGNPNFSGVNDVQGKHNLILGGFQGDMNNRRETTHRVSNRVEGKGNKGQNSHSTEFQNNLATGTSSGRGNSSQNSHSTEFQNNLATGTSLGGGNISQNSHSTEFQNNLAIGTSSGRGNSSQNSHSTEFQNNLATGTSLGGGNISQNSHSTELQNNSDTGNSLERGKSVLNKTKEKIQQTMENISTKVKETRGSLYGRGSSIRKHLKKKFSLKKKHQ